MNVSTCVAPEGYFIFSVHKPAFTTENLRENDHITALGTTDDGQTVSNEQNFPQDNVVENNADWIYEIPNPFSFRGTTYIGKTWADRNAQNPASICLPQPESTSFSSTLNKWLKTQSNTSDATLSIDSLFSMLPRSMQLALAATSTDPMDLIRLAHISGKFIFTTDKKTPKGLVFRKDSHGRMKPDITDKKLFETVANNPFLPDIYKKVMVLNPGVQGNSEIVGEWISENKKSHVFEYLRRNSYIPWGHYAANMAHDAIRYRVSDLLIEDISGMRHLYYQRTYTRLAGQLGITLPFNARSATMEELEKLRKEILSGLNSNNQQKHDISFNRTLWGWNFGFDFAASGYRLHASHQQVHQQFAMIPDHLPVDNFCNAADIGIDMSTYACGDLIADFIAAYRSKYGTSFFSAYEKAIQTNRRMDGKIDGPNQLVVYEDKNILLFVPKAQTSQWELQLMPKDDHV
ncbi:MAG: hypothetical protein PVI90_10050, partial [Desulfobacteraceae bacterium]